MLPCTGTKGLIAEQYAAYRIRNGRPRWYVAYAKNLIAKLRPSLIKNPEYYKLKTAYHHP